MTVRPTWRTGLALAAGMLVLAACGGTTPPPAPAAPAPQPPASAPDPAAPASPARPLTVVATTNVWGAVAGAVAGPGVTVNSIIDDPAADPHAYESTPADAAAIADADLVIANGGHYDEWMEQIASADPAVAAKTVTAFDLRGDPAEENEHVWFDRAAVTGVAGQVAERLAAADPARAGALRQRAAAFTGQVDQVTGRLASLGAARPGTQAYSSEPIAFYLLRGAGIADATPEAFSEAVENETDPPAGALAEVSDGLTQRRVGALVFNPQTETPAVAGLRDVAARGGVPVVEVTETLPPGKDYLQWLDGNRAALAGALGLPA